MIDWLVPICLFWLLAAVFFGGMYDVKAGSAGRQVLGLLVMFVIYLGIFGLLRTVLGGILPPLGSLILPAAIPTMLIGRMGKLIFGFMGVQVERVVFAADAH